MWRDFSSVILLAIVLIGCSGSGPGEIHYGADLCNYCRMTIADREFGSQLVTSKGKIYKFDSIECLAAYEITTNADDKSAHTLWVTDASRPGTFITVEKASIVYGKQLKSPMGLGFMAFKDNVTAEEQASMVEGKILPWPQVKQEVQLSWRLK